MKEYYNDEEEVVKNIQKHLCAWIVVKDEKIKRFSLFGPCFSDFEYRKLFEVLQRVGYSIALCDSLISKTTREQEIACFRSYGYEYEEPDKMVERLFKMI